MIEKIKTKTHQVSLKSWIPLLTTPCFSSLLMSDGHTNRAITAQQKGLKVANVKYLALATD